MNKMPSLIKKLSTNMEKYHVCHSLDDKVDRCSIYKPYTLSYLLVQAMAIKLS